MKLKEKLNIKTKTVKQHQHDITSYVECPEENCNENYVGERGRRLSERVVDHNSRNKNFHIFKHSVERELRTSSLHESSIVRGNYRKNKFLRKVAELLLLKDKRSTVNTQEKSELLKLFNCH